MTCTKDEKGSIVKNIQTHISIMDGTSDVKQDSASVKAIAQTSLEIYTKGNPNVESIFYKSDNAGYRPGQPNLHFL